MRLKAASANEPPGLAALFADLGDGENGFGGTPVPKGEITLPEYLQRCIEMTDAANLPPGYVPQTVFWIVDESGEAVGMVRMRHYLNDSLRECGGHIGYYVRRDKRGKGYGQEALRQALIELRKIGEKRALRRSRLSRPMAGASKAQDMPPTARKSAATGSSWMHKANGGGRAMLRSSSPKRRY